MSTLEQPFIDAINAGQIEGVLLEGGTKGGKRYSKALGDRTCLDGTQLPLSSSDICFLASGTKLLTTIAVLQCVEQGKLSLDSDLSSQLPDVTKLGDEATEKPNFEALRKPLTFRHFLTHSSGLMYEFVVPKIQRWRTVNPAPEGAVGVAARFTTPFAFQPGEGWMYGPGLEWAGLFVEQASGMKLDEYMRKYILEPVGVSHTDIAFFPVKEGLVDRMPDLNPKDPKRLGLSGAMGVSMHDDVPGECYGGGGAYGSSRAYIAVLQSLLSNDGKLLTQETVAEMLKPQLSAQARASMAEVLQGPWGVFVNQGTTSQNPDFGLGGFFVTDDDDGSGLGKGTITWGGGCNSVWFLDPTNEICSFGCLQMGIPADSDKALELKVVFRKGLKEQLAADG